MKMRCEELLAGAWGVLGLLRALQFPGAREQLASSVPFLNQMVRAYLHSPQSPHRPP